MNLATQTSEHSPHRTSVVDFDAKGMGDPIFQMLHSGLAIPQKSSEKQTVPVLRRYVSKSSKLQSWLLVLLFRQTVAAFVYSGSAHLQLGNLEIHITVCEDKDVP